MVDSDPLQQQPPAAQIHPVSARPAPRRRIKGKKKPHLPPVILSTPTFAAFWMLLVVLHAASATFLIASARLYWYLEHPYLSYYVDLVAPAEDRHFKLFGVMLGILGAWNALEWLGLILASIRSRRVTVPSEGIFHVIFRRVSYYIAFWPNGNMPDESRVESSSTTSFHVQPASQRRRAGLYMLFEEGADLFSIESDRFDMVFTIREIIVVIAQSVQCYSFSSRIARPWINHVSVSLVVANCMSVAVLYRLLRQYDKLIKRASVRIASFSSPSWRASPAFARLLCHVLDCLLTFAMSVILPVAIFMPYVEVYDPEGFTFPLTLLYSDTAFPNLIRENQALFARSLMDMGYKFVPHLSIYFCLLVMASVLRTRKEPPPRIAPARLRSPVTRPPASAVSESRQTYMSTNFDAQTDYTAAPHPPLLRSQSKKSLIVRLKKSAVAIGFMALGTIILILHLRATFSNSAGSVVVTTGTQDPNSDIIASAINLCAQPVYPWFSSGDSCAVIEYNCYRNGVAGPAATVFDSLDPNTVSSVIFSHCPALIVPPSIRSFKNLLGFEIYNCTVVEWSAEAALSDDLHPNMIFLIFSLVNMAELPQGVLQKPFPGKLGDIELSRTNLSTLPASLPDVWADVELVYLEYSLFTEIPVELVSIPALSELSLIGNEISTLPDDFSDLIGTDDYYFLALSSNPITSLPSTVRDGQTFGFLSLENTSLAQIPEWVGDRVSDGLYLHGSPICSSTASTDDPTVAWGCSERDDRANGRYPIAITSAIRQA